MNTERTEEQAIYGYRTCRAIFDTRRDDIIRIFYRADRLRVMSPVLKWAADTRRVYRELGNPELDKVADSKHHEGVVMEVKPRFWPRFEPDWVKPGSCWVALDRVENPHNVGAIARTCAFFGMQGLVWGGAEAGARINSALLRMAEGGAERIRMGTALELSTCLEGMKARGLAVVGMETDAPKRLAQAAPRPPACLVFGNEQEGLSRAARQQCTVLASIGGAWEGGSLNVSVSVGVALAEVMRPGG